MKTKEEIKLMEFFLKKCGELGYGSKKFTDEDSKVVNKFDYRSGYIAALMDLSKAMIIKTNLD